MVLDFSLARKLAQRINQKHFKHQHDNKAVTSILRVGDWALVYFPKDGTGKMEKLSQPWHDCYRIVSMSVPEITVEKIYFSDDCHI